MVGQLRGAVVAGLVFVSAVSAAMLPACRVAVSSAGSRPRASAKPSAKPRSPAQPSASGSAAAAVGSAAERRAPAPKQVDAAVADPEASRAFLSHLLEPGIAFGASSASRVTTLALENTARGEAEGMAPRDEQVAAVLKEGERASSPVRLEPG